MKTPPFLLLATLLFWGWQSHLFVVGAIVGGLLEGSRLVKWRWDFEDTDFHRISSLCVVVVMVMFGYVFTTNSEGGGFSGLFHGASSLRNATVSSTMATTSVFRWLPLAFFPFIAAQVYNIRPSVPLTAVSFALRFRRRRGEQTFVGRYLDISYGYFIVCIFAAGVHTNNATHTYFWGQAGLILWALWALRRRRFGILFWLSVMAVVIALGFLGELGIRQVEGMVQNLDARLLARFFRPRTDAAQSVTSIGQIGELLLSPRIVIRLQPHQLGVAPAYLREASYRNYFSPKQTWTAGSRSDFEDVSHAVNDDTTWILQAGKTNQAAVTIAAYLEGRSRDTGEPEGLLPLPSGFSLLKKLPVYSLRLNKNGAVLASGPGLLIFDAYYGPGATCDSPPDTGTNQLDLSVPTNEAPAIQQVIAEMNLAATNDTQTRMAVEQFFASKFTYSTWEGLDKRATASETPLTRFLLTSRSGHCEYFATATVLLLRKLGIPARYAVGYSVHETSGTGYVVRERDAHAWCLAWDREKNVWVDLDTTPASWLAIEGRRASFTDWLSDARSWLVFQLEKLRWRESDIRQYVLWTLVPVILALLYFIIFQRRTKKPAAKDTGVVETPIWPGHDSAFYRLEKTLATRGLPREPGEALSEWLERALTEPGLAGLRGPLRELLQLHYRYRFDPPGLTDAEKAALVKHVEAVLATLAGN